MTDALIAIFEQNTALRRDVDLFYLEMPLDKSGMWFMDRQTVNAPTRYREYDIFYRGKTKSSVKSNVDYLQSKIDDLTVCELNDGSKFKLDLLNTFDYIGKDTEGYYVFTSTVRLFR